MACSWCHGKLCSSYRLKDYSDGGARMEIGTVRMAIGALSGRTGTNVETIRYYERAGLLPIPPRTPGGYRLYGSAHVKRLSFVRRARALGFSLDEIRRLLKLADERKRPCAEVREVAAA